MSSSQHTKYTLIVFGQEKPLETEFEADITTSGFLKNMRDDLEDTSPIVNLAECPCEFSNMNNEEALQFIKLWEAVSTESGKKLNELLEPQIVCLNPEVLEPISHLIKPTETDITLTNNYIITELKKRCIQLTESDTTGIKECNTYRDLIENIALPTLFKYIRLANFLDISTLLKLFSYLIAKSMRAFTRLSHEIKPIIDNVGEPEHLAEPLDEPLAEPEPLEKELD